MQLTTLQTHGAGEAAKSHPVGTAPLQVLTDQNWSYHSPGRWLASWTATSAHLRTDRANSETAEEGDSVLHKGRKKKGKR